MMRCSVGVKSRPSTRVWKRPSPPNMLSTTRNTRFGSSTISPVPRSGLAWIRFRLVGYHQVADELAVLLHLDRAHRDLDTLVHVVEQADAQVTGEALVDQLHRRHAAAHDALLAAQVVGANRTGFSGVEPAPRRFRRKPPSAVRRLLPGKENPGPWRSTPGEGGNY
jgi:hypothetical protein